MHDGVRRLLRAVVDQAVADLEAKDPRVREEAETWLREEGVDTLVAAGVAPPDATTEVCRALGRAWRRRGRRRR